MTPPTTTHPTGYWLIEPDILDRYAADPALHPFTRLLFSHLAAVVSDRLGLAADGVSLEVIEANYHGPYPCLAARSVGGELKEGLDEAVEAEIRQILRDPPVRDILDELLPEPSRRAA